MKRAIAYIIGILLVILQNGAINYIDILGVSFSILIPYLVIVSVYMDDYNAGIAGLLSGLMLDITTGGIFGIHALLFSAVCYTIGHFRKNFYRDNIVMITGLVAVSTAVCSIVEAAASSIVYNMDGMLIIALKSLILLPLLNSIVGFVMYRLFRNSFIKLN